MTKTQEILERQTMLTHQAGKNKKGKNYLSDRKLLSAEIRRLMARQVKGRGQPQMIGINRAEKNQYLFYY